MIIFPCCNTSFNWNARLSAVNYHSLKSRKCCHDKLLWHIVTGLWLWIRVWLLTIFVKCRTLQNNKSCETNIVSDCLVRTYLVTSCTDSPYEMSWSWDLVSWYLSLANAITMHYHLTACAASLQGIRVLSPTAKANNTGMSFTDDCYCILMTPCGECFLLLTKRRNRHRNGDANWITSRYRSENSVNYRR